MGAPRLAAQSHCNNPTPINDASPLFIGHSLINHDMPQMFGQIAADAGVAEKHATQVNNGAPLKYNWTYRHEADWTFPYPPVHFAGDILPSGEWDVLVMTEGIPLETNITWNETPVYAGLFTDLARQYNAGTRSYIYETWHSRDEANWLDRITTDLALWEGIIDDVNATRGEHAMFLIPAGQALRQLVLRVESGQVPGLNNRAQLFVDDIHLNDMGNYFVACVMFATIYRQSPQGLRYQTTNQWGGSYDAPTAAQAAIMQEIAWDVVRNYPRSGFLCDGGGNQAPNGTIAAPSGNRTITAGQSVSFSGSASDPDGNTPLTFLWNFDGGATNSTVEDPGSVTFNTPGTFTVSFTVTDSLGLADPSPDTVTITVQAPANQAPNGTIDAPSGNRTITAGQSVSFSASASDPDGNTPLTYLWNFDGGASNRTVEDPGSVTFDSPGTFTVSFTVTDSLGLADPTPDTVTITVQAPANQAPNGTIDAPSGNRTITAGQSVSFSASASDPDGNTPLTYLWNFDGGASNRTVEDPGSVTFDSPGTFTVSFTVTDSLGLADPTPDSVTITVQAAANQAPNGTIVTPNQNWTIDPGQSLTFTGSASDPDGHTPLTYLWNFDGGATNSTVEDPGQVFFDNPGVYTVTFTVTDSLGLADPSPDSVIVTVRSPNQAPNGTIVSPSSGAIIEAGQSVYFNGSASDPDGPQNFTYLWNFDGGATNRTVREPGNVVFDTPGDYDVTFTVTDDEGLADPTPATVNVRVLPGEENSEPVGTIETPTDYVTIAAGDSVYFEGSGVDFDNHTPLTYAWNFDGGAPASSQQNPGWVQFDQPGEFQVRFTVTDSRGLADQTPAVCTVYVAACSQPAILNQDLIQGLRPLLLRGVACLDAGHRIAWRNMTTDQLLAVDQKDLELDPKLDGTSRIRLNVYSGAADTWYFTEVTVLVPQSTVVEDLNGNGCNDMGDIYTYASLWGDGLPSDDYDANGDNALNVLDFFYINTTEEGNCP
ncbi:PKD domain-containing protein [Sulfidibacter corallicola]|uniref:PKD domain-containing protein n=1 Tax=Sulfidibacter corallicola TaxID=2818388 RepID=A0A8A4TNN1_SULCO|nr:PKD domain-containing protein [Sulfidibacter corallicola]QTD51163.1 PKD domain-containing protein [Sulfidibacter corallicola]